MKFTLLKPLTLHKKFILITSLSIIIFMVAIGAFITQRESHIMYRDIEKQGRILARTLAIPVINDLIYERLGLVEEGGLIDNYVTEIFRKKDIDLIYIAVLDEKGRVLSHNDFREYGKIYNDPLTLKALHSDETVVQRFMDSKTGHDAIDFATPLAIGKKRWGTLKFAVSLKKVEQEVKSTIMRVVMLTFIALIMGFIIIILLGRRFIGPITHLAKTMEKAGGDRLDVKVDIKGKDELALLGESFNRMIDRIREANLELKKTHEKLLQSEKLASIGILASGVAHEINNPLGGLFNAVEMLERNWDNEDFRKKYLGLIREGLQKIETTIGRLLWMSRKGERRPQKVDLKKALNDALDLIGYRLKRYNISYIENIKHGLVIFIDPNDLQQILINLMVNAEQAMEATGGTLTVKGYSRDSKVVIEVSDTGEGIDDNEIGKIFDPFYTTKQPGEGTGLGLWLTYEIVKNYNGDISVEGKKGEGSTFKLEFDKP
jgi:signal transduction histidine kinase